MLEGWSSVRERILEAATKAGLALGKDGFTDPRRLSVAEPLVQTMLLEEEPS